MAHTDETATRPVVTNGDGRPADPDVQVMPPTEGLPNDAEAIAPGELSMLPPPDEVERLEERRRQLVQRHGRTLRVHAARGTIINTGFMILLSALGLVRGFSFAHFLTKEDYAVWGLLAVSLGTLMWLKQVGIGDKYLQQSDPDQEVAFQKAFTLELMFNAIAMVVLGAVLPLFALIYGHAQIIPPGLVVLLVLPANALQAPMWIYYRNMDFVRERTLASVEPVVGFVVGMAFAAAGYGYWALAAAVLSGAWASAIVATIASPYKLRLRFDRGTLRSYASFSWPLFIANGSSMMLAQSAVLVGNARLGLAGIGVIALCSTITTFTQRVDGLITGTLYPAICAARDKVNVLKESFIKSNRLALMWAMPFGTGISLFCADLVHFGLGEKWRLAITLLQVTGLVAALGHIGFNWDAYMRASGRTRPLAVAAAASLITWLGAGIPLLLAFGLRGMAVGIGLQMLANLCCRAYYLSKLFNGFDYLSHAMRAILPTVPAAAAVLGMRLLESGRRSLAEATAELFVYLAVTAVATWWGEKDLLREAVGYVFARQRKGAGAADPSPSLSA